jgi:hypothetical protein
VPVILSRTPYLCMQVKRRPERTLPTRVLVLDRDGRQERTKVATTRQFTTSANDNVSIDLVRQ